MADRANQVVELTTEEMAQVQGGAQVDYFLKLPGIDGESTDSTHGVGGGGGAGKVSMHDSFFV